MADDEIRALRDKVARLERDLQGRIQACIDHGRNHSWQQAYIRKLEAEILALRDREENELQHWWQHQDNEWAEEQSDGYE